MAATFRANARILVAMAVILAQVAELCSFPATLPLERAFPTNHGMDLDTLVARDVSRHKRRLQSSAGLIDFPALGSYDPFHVGLYYTKLRLGSPPKEFYVQIDTGSDVLWVSCSSCNGCPKTSGLNIQLNFYNPKSSSTASSVPCSDQICTYAAQFTESKCSSNNQCAYTFMYSDGSGTSGYYFKDLIHFDGNSKASNSSASVVFGCSTLQKGELTKPYRAVDGIIGFGKQDTSIISQLSSKGIVPKVFSHCLRGDQSGGGILVLGEIKKPNIVYTSFVQSQSHYTVNLQSISVNGQVLSIDPSVFRTSNTRGTIFDSGTTLTYLVEEAYDPFVASITESVSRSVEAVKSEGRQCYIIPFGSRSVSEIFPQVILNFAGSASMILKPVDYLINPGSVGGKEVRCLGIHKIPGDGTTILGDLVLKDKIIVYDLAGQRIGWADDDCKSLEPKS